MNTYEKPDKFIMFLWLTIKAIFFTGAAIAVVYIGFHMLKAGGKQALNSHYQENGAPIGSPYDLEQVDREMTKRAGKIPVGEGLDMMIEARKQGVDLSTTAAENMGANRDAAVENYIYHQYFYRHRIGSERMNQLLDKIAAEGKPTVAQLAGYQDVAYMCSYKLMKDCQAWNALMSCQGHCAGQGPMIRLGGGTYEMCLVSASRHMDVKKCLK